ncbi:ferredoxin [Amycolatopsis sp. NPDC059027]|uniref:ferredoxin n=1 Tax=unclassified Amycolatopsis TaxID=2618356 RepID=UPI00366D8890
MGMRLPLGNGPRISVDNDRCELYGICAMEAPDVFDLGNDGRLRFRKRLLAPDDLEQAVAAARACPMQAVVLRGDIHG